MRHFLSLCLAGLFVLSACSDTPDTEVERAVKSVNVIDETNLNDIMLTAADPDEAVEYFKRTAKDNPNRIDIRRGLAASLVRAKKNSEAVRAWKSVAEHPEATESDHVDYADAMIRAGDWAGAEKMLDTVRPTYETHKRYRLEAMIADSNKEWKRADTFYETAVDLTTTPSGTLNNWGYSKLTRGDFAGAEKLFSEALTYDPTLFTAKNNLTLARGAQGVYQLPIVEMSQTERAKLLHTLALSAIKRGDVVTDKGLLEEAIDTHPQHFEEAVRALRAIEA